MSTPGRFHGETGAAIGVKAGEVRVIPLRVDGVADNSWYLPVGDTDFDIQVSDVQLGAKDTSPRPTRITVDIIRKAVDRTARCTRSVPQAGSRFYADNFGGQEYVNDVDGIFSFTISHDGPSTVSIGKIVVKGINPRAQTIHELGGYNRWSDGSVR